jgi:hypothetical protein
MIEIICGALLVKRLIKSSCFQMSMHVLQTRYPGGSTQLGRIRDLLALRVLGLPFSAAARFLLALADRPNNAQLEPCLYRCEYLRWCGVLVKPPQHAFALVREIMPLKKALQQGELVGRE